MLLPGITVAGVPTVVRARSAWMPVATTSVAVAELGPKAWFVELTVAVSVITVPFAVPTFTFTTIEKLAAVLPSMFNVVQTTLPVPPTAGVRQVQPAGADIETKVAFAGTASINVALSAALGPLLVTTCV